MNISFVIPAYNAEQTLKESVDSILNNNFIEGDEIIIVDDKSTDNTLTLAKKLATTFRNKIRILENKQNIGCPASRNIGIKSAKNELIFNLDSDNILEEHSIKILKDELIRQSADIVSFQEYWYFKKDKTKINHKWICKEGQLLLEDIFAGNISPAPGGNFLYTKNSWEKIGGYWEYGKGLHEAWGFSLKQLINQAKFIVVSNTYYFHRFSHDSLFVREKSKKDEEYRILNLFIQHFKDLVEEKDLKYIENNPDWFNELDTRPIKLKNRPLGKNGILLKNPLIKRIIYKLFNL